MTQESPISKTSLIGPVDTLVERIEPTHIELSVEEVPPMDELMIVAEVSRAVIESTGDRCPRQYERPFYNKTRSWRA